MSRYCPDHDPLLVAGHIDCRGCGSRSYPTEAAWIGEDLILATYEVACEYDCGRRRDSGAVLLDLGSDQTVPLVPRPRRCRAIASTTRRPCRAYAPPGSGYCFHHDPAKRAAP
jgi:hypothetical protein